MQNRRPRTDNIASGSNDDDFNDSQATLPVEQLPPVTPNNYENAASNTNSSAQSQEHTDNIAHNNANVCLPPEYEQLPHLWTSIPHSAEKEWVTVCSRVCQQICDAEDNESLHHSILQLLLLPRRVLHRVAHQRGAARSLRQSLFRFASSQQTNVANTQPIPDVEERHDERTIRARAISKATALMKAGHKIRAVNTLLQETPILNVTDEVVAQLIELHPASTDALPILQTQWR